MCFGSTPDPAPVAAAPVTPAAPPNRYGETDGLKPGQAPTTTDNAPAGTGNQKLSTVNPQVGVGAGLTGPM